MPWNRRGHGRSAGQTDALREALRQRAEELFLAVFGDPGRRNAREWRGRRSEAVSMCMSGPKRGQWYDHAAGEGGDLLDLVARAHCGRLRARDDFPAVLAAAARLTGHSLDHPPDRGRTRQLAERRERQEAFEARERQLRDDHLLGTLISHGETVTPGSPPGRYLRSRAITSWPDIGLCWCRPLADSGIRGGRLHSLTVWGRRLDGMPAGGQRILLTARGRRASRQVAKPAFGRIAGFPAMFPARDGHADAPLP